MISSAVTAICFLVMAGAAVFIAYFVRKGVKTVRRLEDQLEPVIVHANKISKQGELIAQQFNTVSGHLSTAAKNLSESTDLIREEVAELKELVGHTAVIAKDKVALVSRTIDKTQLQVTNTTDFIQARIVEPAREVAAIMAGLRKGLEVLLAPSPKPIDRVYADDEMFIG
jgi:methyl-accepting chemotaxis protein